MDLGYLISLAFTGLKWMLLLLVAYIIYLLYWLIYSPYRERQYFKKFPNVKMSDKFNPLIGDIALWIENCKKGLGAFYHYINEVANSKNIDIRFVQIGERGVIDIVSTKAMDEVEKLVPQKIDRGEPEHTAIWNLIPTSFINERSTEHTNKRKKALIEYLGINRASRHIPILIESVDTYISIMKEEKDVNFSKLSKSITFDAMSKQLLGNDYKEIKMDFEYQDPETGSNVKMSFTEFFMSLCHSEFAAYMNPKTKILKPLADRYLIEPYKTNRRNNLYFRKKLIELAESSNDSDSMYKALKRNEDFSKED